MILTGAGISAASGIPTSEEKMDSGKDLMKAIQIL